jgi:Tfp pilus assembly pilus retraction ATPase PilT
MQGAAQAFAEALELERSGQLSKHIVTLEDPIEYVFVDNVPSFSQRQIGRTCTRRMTSIAR